MGKTVKRVYEGMFLVDSADASSNWDGVLAEINTVMERAGAEVLSMKKWDDRRLCFEMQGHKRGTYILTYFKVDGSAISGMERDVQLSEQLVRVLILKAEHMTKEDMEAATPLERAETEDSSGPGVEEEVVSRKTAVAVADDEDDDVDDDEDDDAE